VEGLTRGVRAGSREHESEARPLAVGGGRHAGTEVVGASGSTASPQIASTVVLRERAITTARVALGRAPSSAVCHELAGIPARVAASRSDKP